MTDKNTQETPLGIDPMEAAIRQVQERQAAARQRKVEEEKNRAKERAARLKGKAEIVNPTVDALIAFKKVTQREQNKSPDKGAIARTIDHLENLEDRAKGPKLSEPPVSSKPPRAPTAGTK